MIGIFIKIKLLVAADVLVLLVKQATGITIVQPATSSSWMLMTLPLNTLLSNLLQAQAGC
jgi:hypothetical protein